MRLLARLNRPWLHFIVLGSVLFYLQETFFPAPKPVVGPLSEARTEALQQQWFSTVGRPPTADQMTRLVAEELDRDMLFQRALELKLYLYDTVVKQRLLLNMRFLDMGKGKTDEELYRMALDMRLHLSDEVIKRRMIQVMEQLLLVSDPPREPSEAEVAAEFAKRREELRHPTLYSIEHVYFNRERAAEAGAVIAKIKDENLTPQQARELGSPFLPGYQFTAQTPEQLARHFGNEFVDNLLQAQPQAEHWVGPVQSTYGVHCVWVDAITPARDATLDEVRVQLLRDLETRKKDAALQGSIAALRQHYEILL